MPIKRDPGDRFALGLELMLLDNSHMLCKCDEKRPWLAVHVCR